MNDIFQEEEWNLIETRQCGATLWTNQTGFWSACDAGEYPWDAGVPCTGDRERALRWLQGIASGEY